MTKGGDETRSDLPVCMHAGAWDVPKVYALPVEARCQCPHGGLRTLREAKHLKVKRLAMAEVPNRKYGRRQRGWAATMRFGGGEGGCEVESLVAVVAAGSGSQGWDAMRGGEPAEAQQP